MSSPLRPSFVEQEKAVRQLCHNRGLSGLFMLVDSGVESMVGDFMPEVPRLVVRAGERSKSLKTVEKVWRFLISGGAVRRSVLINVGGGMVSDLGGFAAATFMRGIACVNVPTTLLAAVDASRGGKTAINFDGLKNEVGAFALPAGVFPLTCLFDHLPEREWLSGVGEVLKTALLDSASLFELASSEEFIVERRPDVVEEVVRRCAAFKTRIVEEDFRESGKRRILNLGHTAGHAIEAWSLAHGTPMPHGIAVAHGLWFALERSCREAGLPDTVLKRYEEVLEQYFPPLTLEADQLNEAWEYMAYDKKNESRNSPAWVLLKDIGQPVY